MTDPAVTEPAEPNRRTRIGSYSLCLDDEGRILLARLSVLEVDVGAWTMPGGGIEFGEHPGRRGRPRARGGDGADRGDRRRRRDLLARLPAIGLRPWRRSPLPRDHLPDADRRRRASRRDRRDDRHVRLDFAGRARETCDWSSLRSSGSSSPSRIGRREEHDLDRRRRAGRASSSASPATSSAGRGSSPTTSGFGRSSATTTAA